MKLKAIILICAGLVFVTCSKEIDAPKACLQAPETGVVYEVVSFEACDDADYHVLWPGDTMHVYELRNEVFFDKRGRQIYQTGYHMIDGKYNYIYRKPGTYTVVMVATNSANNTEDFKKDIIETTIVIEEE